MSDAMRTRGPDGSGFWISSDGRTGLAHRRLSIVDLTDAAAQPMWSADGRYAIVFNGEIYNHAELREGLKRRGAKFRSHSDTEVLLQSFVASGAAMLETLRGMFAFVIWDQQTRELFAARDPYGIKPLYYATTGGVFRAASQVRALVAGGVARRPSAAGVAGFLLRGSVPEPFTIIEDVRALPAGHFMTVTASGAETPRRYFSFATELLQASEAPAAGDAQAIFREALRDSVRHHLLADVPVGVFLSGGKDSTTIAAIARELGASPQGITLAFDEYRGTANDEVPAAACAARALGIDHSIVTLTRDEFVGELPAAVAAMDQPSIDGLNSYFVSRAAASAGLKAILSGTGGDELLGGYSTFQRIPATIRAVGQLARVPHLGRSVRRLWSAFWPDHRRFSPKTPGILEYGGTYGNAYLIRRGLFMPWELEKLIDRDMAREGLETLDIAHLIEEPLRPDPGSQFGRVAALESAWFLRDRLLRDIDWASMAHSLEVRVPLVDVPLLRAVAPLVIRQPKRGKEWLSGSPLPPLPREIRERPKSGFLLPLHRWLPVQDRRQQHRFGMRAWALTLYRHWFGSE